MPPKARRCQAPGRGRRRRPAGGVLSWPFRMHLLAQGAALGFSAAASPGPFQAFLLAQALRLGPGRALPLALAPLLSDGPIVALSLLALSRAPDGLLRALHVLGGGLLVWLAAGALRSRVSPGPAAAPPPSAGRRALWQAVALNALSPGPWIFWTVISGPILVSAWRASAGQALWFLAGFYLLLCGGNAGVILAFGSAHRLGPGAARALARLSGVALLLFGLHQLWRGTLGWRPPGA